MENTAKFAEKLSCICNSRCTPRRIEQIYKVREREKKLFDIDTQNLPIVWKITLLYIITK